MTENYQPPAGTFLADMSVSTAIGKTEAEIETAHGETPGDRLGDTPVPVVPQTRDGAGNPITAEQAAYAAQHGTGGSDAPPSATVGAFSFSRADIVGPAPTATPTHVALPVAHHSRLVEIVDNLEAGALRGYQHVIDELRTLLHAK